MHYLKNLLFNFLINFLSLHIFLGVEVVDVTKLPHLGGDILFAGGLGFLNSLIYPLLRMTGTRPLAMRILLIALAVNFAACALLKLLPLGITIDSLKGYAFMAIMTSAGSFLTNFLEKRAAISSSPLGCPVLPNEEVE